ncbi:putative phospholipid-transporting ATPase IF [Monocercomonoides exilis]|uniref:putative phospholipid-transporting ATPase IF n=1 Tax=Monocercomonoides exilis TaxID=2049356 RepID=UPI00355A2F54|nr:putative phospholipid-transporting ATPase IF [Monocercomonoides exilis]|eukprot:MONOS_7057.1-p1 / transcript=MONOS_7057.1 / gene=MONOS_7057 / organism=Monocercomonoides_exilis_PA203 / gene_product=Putative phospholipid-transporting ATPase IF / transcript_product=Putative phospholipid-transporting ATPase IF / location=Mono_scaffold00233:51107-57823(-) / protein_length=1903 / sequence_SO=supercontig / SO=protein_coding / is_pseudo=false
MLKDGYEDFLRYKSDNRTNGKPVFVKIGNRFENLETYKLRVGDFVLLRRGEQIPADMILLSSSQENGMCYVNTMNLDGETNLKIKRAHPDIYNSLRSLKRFRFPKREIEKKSGNRTLKKEDNLNNANNAAKKDSQYLCLLASQLNEWKGRIVCQAPDRHLHQFAGRIEFSNALCTSSSQNASSQTNSSSSVADASDSVPQNEATNPSSVVPISLTQLLLKGCSVKNTRAVLGVVVYTGKESKIQLNSSAPKPKFSSFDRRLNISVFAMLMITICIILFSAVGYRISNNKNVLKHPYLFLKEQTIPQFFYNILGYFVMFSYLIPISLFVSLEISRFIQSIFLELDEKMFDFSKGEEGRMQARTSTLNEELGLITHILSDKTGTLTSNRMRFRSCCVGKDIFDLKEKGTKASTPNCGSSSSSTSMSSQATSILKERSHEGENRNADGTAPVKHTHHPLQSLSSTYSHVIHTGNQQRAESHTSSTQLDDQHSSSSSASSSSYSEASTAPVNAENTSLFSSLIPSTPHFNAFHFITCLLLCHDAVLEKKPRKPKTTKISFLNDEGEANAASGSADKHIEDGFVGFLDVDFEHEKKNAMNEKEQMSASEQETNEGDGHDEDDDDDYDDMAAEEEAERAKHKQKKGLTAMLNTFLATPGKGKKAKEAKSTSNFSSSKKNTRISHTDSINSKNDDFSCVQPTGLDASTPYSYSDEKSQRDCAVNEGDEEAEEDDRLSQGEGVSPSALPSSPNPPIPFFPNIDSPTTDLVSLTTSPAPSPVLSSPQTSPANLNISFHPLFSSMPLQTSSDNDSISVSSEHSIAMHSTGNSVSLSPFYRTSTSLHSPSDSQLAVNKDAQIGTPSASSYLSLNPPLMIPKKHRRNPSDFSSTSIAFPSTVFTPMAYQSTSPDEIALLNALSSVGLSFMARSLTELSATIIGDPLQSIFSSGQRTFSASSLAPQPTPSPSSLSPSTFHWKIVGCLPFSSERRRMSIVVRDNKGSTMLYVKGADSTVLNLCGIDEDGKRKETSNNNGSALDGAGNNTTSENAKPNWRERSEEERTAELKRWAAKRWKIERDVFAKDNGLNPKSIDMTGFEEAVGRNNSSSNTTMNSSSEGEKDEEEKPSEFDSFEWIKVADDFLQSYISLKLKSNPILAASVQSRKEGETAENPSSFPLDSNQSNKNQCYDDAPDSSSVLSRATAPLAPTLSPSLSSLFPSFPTFYSYLASLLHHQHISDQAIINSLTEYARSGFRTLLVACRYISPDEAASWETELTEAEGAIMSREERIEQCFNKLESMAPLNLVGATAVEDELQDECPETIDFLTKCGIRFWVLTGDKVDTAVNVGLSCRLIHADVQPLFLTRNELAHITEVNDGQARSENALIALPTVLTLNASSFQSLTNASRSSKQKHKKTYKPFSPRTIEDHMQKKQLDSPLVAKSPSQMNDEKASVAFSFLSAPDPISTEGATLAERQAAEEARMQKQKVMQLLIELATKVDIPQAEINKAINVKPEKKPFSRTNNTDDDQPSDEDNDPIAYEASTIKGSADHRPSLIVDGHCINLILSSKRLMRLFLLLSTRSSSVICCRISPLQKALVLRLVKMHLKSTTLAVGDGANDVSMIQEAHVGVGIVGLEGTQASQVSDFSIGQFKTLKRLLCLHGHFNMVRLSSLIKYSFYKNVVFVTPVVCFLCNSLFSQQLVYEDWFATAYNVIITSFPILVVAIMGKDATDDILLTHPEIYRTFSKGRALSLVGVAKWVVFGIFHGLICYFVPYFVFKFGQFTPLPYVEGFDVFGNLSSAICVFLVTFTICWMVEYVNLVFVIMVTASVLVYYAFMSLVSGVFSLSPLFYNTFFRSQASPVFHMAIFLAFSIGVIPLLFGRWVKKQTQKGFAMWKYLPEGLKWHHTLPSLKSKQK